ncbi:MAG: hypothetical protein WC307_01520 [Candidatus Nanoarchaeia archaeon]|jgi:hypothetical protein
MDNYTNTIEEVVSHWPGRNAYAFIGMVGSYNLEHDLDLLTISNGCLQPGEFFIDQNNLLGKIREATIANGDRLVPFQKICYQDEVAWLSKLKPGKNGVLLHNLTYLDQDSIKQYNPPRFLEEINKNMITLYGDADNIKGVQNHENPHTYLYFMLQDANVLNTDYPTALKEKKLKHLINYVHKWLGKPVITEGEWSESKCLNEFNNCLKLIDQQAVTN